MIADLAGKNALVTGGAQGIGCGIVLKLAEQGANVAVEGDFNKGKHLIISDTASCSTKTL